MARPFAATRRSRGYVATLIPANSVPPAITGTPTVGQTLTLSNGTWSHAPTGYARQWTRDGVAISGATGATYVLGSGDSGHALRGMVIASNASGFGQVATSAAVTVA